MTFDQELRDRLAEAAEGAPPFRPELLGLGRGREGTASETSAPVVPLRRRMPGRWVGVAAAAALVAGGGAWWALDGRTPDSSPGTVAGTDDGGGVTRGSAASCAAVLTWDGRTWTPGPTLVSVPREGSPVGTGTLPGCDDGGGAVAARQVTLTPIPGVPTSEAVLGDSTVWVLQGAPPPAGLHALTEPVRCTAPGTVVGAPVGVLGPNGSDGGADLARPPYVLELLAEQPEDSPYRVRMVDVRVTAATGADAGVLRQALDSSTRVRVTTTCSGTTFVATAISRG